MFFELFTGVAALSIGALIKILIENVKPFISKIANKYTWLNKIFELEQAETFEKRMGNSIQNLRKASADIDVVLAEINKIYEEKESSINLLEDSLLELQSRESILKEKVEALEKIPIESVKHLEKILDKGDKKSAYRDYFLFALGVIFSVAVTIVLKKLGYA